MKALVMCLADPSGNPRPNRMIRQLSDEGYSVDALCYHLADGLPIRKQYTIPQPNRRLWQRVVRVLIGMLGSVLARFKFTSSRLAVRINDQRYNLLTQEESLLSECYNLLVVEDLQLLPLAFRVRKQAKILFDAREFYTRQNEESLLFRWFEYPLRLRLCRFYLPQCDQLITVSPGLANAYAKEFGVKMEVIRSTPYYTKMAVSSTNKNQIRMVHHGGANPNRGLSNMIEVVRRLDPRFSLDFYLVGNKRNIQSLKKQAEGCDRIRFHEPMPFDQIVPMLNGYDIGFFYVEPSTFNLYHCLPNKLFEFIQGRLAVAIGPSPDMAELINQYQCGFVAPEFSINAMVDTLAALTPADIDRAKQNSARAAQELCYERESEKLMAALNAIMKF